MPTRLGYLTAEGFFDWPDEPGFRQELIRGVIVTCPLPGALHGEVAAEVGLLVANHVDRYKLGTCYAAGTGFFIERDPDTVCAPDFAFVGTHRQAAVVDATWYLPFAPELAVEVRCADDCDERINERIRRWLAAGSSLVWDVDPVASTVVVHRPGSEPVTLHDDQEIDGAEVIPGFRCGVADFFK